MNIYVQKIRDALRAQSRFLDISVFLDNTNKKTLIIKAERVVMGLFAATAHLPEGHRMRMRVRAHAWRWYEVLVEELQHDAVAYAFATQTRMLSLLLTLLSIDSLIRKENEMLLQAALIECAELLREIQKGVDGHTEFATPLTRLFPHLAVQAPVLEEQAVPRKQQVEEGAHVKDYEETPISTPTSSTVAQTRATDAPVGSDNERIVKSDEKKTAPPQTQARRRSSLKAKAKSANRRVLILNVLSHRGVVSMKELSAAIPDVTPKTLQRELQKLVADGIVAKEGSKRWTTYRIV